jgi:predicted ATPase/signal transduction histidine kinase
VIALARWVISAHRALVLHRVAHACLSSIIAAADWGDPMEEAAAAARRHEVRTLRSIDAPGVVKPVALEEPSGRVALGAEGAGPESLAARLTRGAVDTDRFLVLAVQMAAIVARVHQRHIVHRDLRPDHFVLADGRVTLADLESTMTASGLIAIEPVGALLYMAPEATGRLRRGPDERSDLYSLGAIFYEMLTGRPPFPATDPVELVHAHLARTPVAPAILDPGVPRPLSDITLRLLAKDPDARYQTSAGLLADLEEAHAQWRAGRTIEPFELGRDELTREFPLPARLYGRERAEAVLAGALERVSSGATELLIVTGRAGVGKSVLVAQLAGPARRCGRLVVGKCDLLAGNLPYAPLLELFGELVRELLAGPEAERADLRDRILRAIAPNARVLTDFLPGLVPLLGEPPPVPALGPAETQTRFHMVMQAFVCAVAGACPLVCFLDDAQWADAATLTLLRVIAETPELRQCLVIVAYRSEEVGAQHATSLAIEALRGAGVAVHALEVAPLEVVDITALLADALRIAPEVAAPLAEAVHKKTAGNPLFVRRFLQYLHDAGLFVFDRQTGAWRWDLAQITGAPVTENVVDLLMSAIARLPDECQRALAIGACIGARFELDLVAAVCGISIMAAGRALAPALHEELIVPAWPAYPGGPATYSFAHDRIHQAVQSLESDAAHQRTHLRIGRLLAAAAERSAVPPFAIADQLNLAIGAMTDPAELLDLAELDLRAGIAAKVRSAHGPALAYLTRGLELLPDRAWSTHHALWYRLHREAVECAGLDGQHARADALVEAALPHAGSLEETAELHALQIMAATLGGSLPHALRVLGRGLLAFGVTVPRDDLPAAASAELAAARDALTDSAADGLLQAPPMAGDELCFLRILASALPAASYADPHLLAWLSARLVRSTLRHGPAPQTPFGLGMLAFALLDARDHRMADKAGQLAIRLAERLRDPVATSRARFMYAGLICFWLQPIRNSISHLRRADAELLALGDHQFAPWNSQDLVSLLFSQGSPLDEVLAAVDHGLGLAKRFDHAPAGTFLALVQSGLRDLAGTARGQAAPLPETASPLNAGLYHILRLQTAYLLGDLDAADAAARAAAEKLPFLGGVFFWIVDCALYDALTAAAQLESAGTDRRAALRARIDGHLRELEAWAELCPENVLHKVRLLEGEIAAVEQRPLDAARLYERAIDRATREGFIHDAALAHERCGRMYLRFGLRRDAETHFADALRGYVRWGATAKVRLLAREFPRIARAPVRAPSATGPGIDLDVVGLLRAAEALAREVELPRLLEQLMRICLETAGADRGLLVLDEDGAPFVRSAATATAVSLERTPLEAAPDIARAVVEHLRRTGDRVVLDDARRSAFAVHAQASATPVRSVLAVPIHRRNRAVGVLYLENTLVDDAFSPERVRSLDLLSGHISVALENSLLFEERKRGELATQLLADASSALVESLDYAATLARVAQLAVPALADMCAVDVVEDGRLRRVAAAHVDPAQEPLIVEAGAGYLDPGSPHPEAQVLRTGRPWLASEIDDAVMQAQSREAREAALGAALGVRSVVAVPLFARGRILGAMCFASRQPGRYTARDLPLAQELGRRAGMAIDNARLYAGSQAAVQVRDQFLSVASHELRTPLTSLNMTVQALLDHTVPATPDNLRKTFSIARRQIARLTHLVDELLNVSRITAGRLALELDDVDLAAVVRDVVERFAGELSRSGTRVAIRATAVVGRWDRSALDQVVTNIVSNALKFGGGKPIDVVVEAVDGTARLVVTDRGIGIPSDRIPHIFERFERAVSARQYGGLGLGLYIARSIIEALGGSIEARSAGPGEGATFTVALPRTRAGRPR